MSAIEEKIGSNGPDNGYSSKHEYVDLGLPSGTLWATCNLGASKPEEFGLYYTWGETTGYPAEKAGFGNRYVIQSDSYFNNKYIKKYFYEYLGCEGKIDDKLVLDLVDDAAAVNWGLEWCMPTKDQLYELYTECKWEWAKLGEHYGYNVIGPNNNNIFIPAAGHAHYGILYLPEEFCILWSSSLNEDPNNANGPECAWYLVKSDRYEEFSLSLRDSGRTIRPVRNL